MSQQFIHSHDCNEKHGDAVWGIAYADPQRVVSVSADGTAKYWNGASGQTMRVSSPHPVGITSVSVNMRGTKVLYNSLEGLTSLWDLETGEIVGKHESYVRTSTDQEPAWSVSLHPDGETFAATGGSGNVTLHSANPTNFGDRLAKLESGRAKMGMCTVYSPDGSRVALSLETGQIFIFDIASKTLSSTYTAHAACVRSISWSDDSSLLLSASDDRQLTLFDVRTGGSGGGAVASLVGHSSWVLSSSFSPDKKLAVSGSADKTIRVWDIGTRSTVSHIQDTGEVWSVVWRPQGAGVPTNAAGGSGTFVSGGEDGVVKWWRSAGVS